MTARFVRLQVLVYWESMVVLLAQNHLEDEVADLAWDGREKQALSLGIRVFGVNICKCPTFSSCSDTTLFTGEILVPSSVSREARYI